MTKSTLDCNLLHSDQSPRQQQKKAGNMMGCRIRVKVRVRVRVRVFATALTMVHPVVHIAKQAKRQRGTSLRRSSRMSNSDCCSTASPVGEVGITFAGSTLRC